MSCSVAGTEGSIRSTGAVNLHVAPSRTTMPLARRSRTSAVTNSGFPPEWRWISPDDLRAAVAAAPWALSPWLLEQIEQLDRREGWQAGQR